MRCCQSDLTRRNPAVRRLFPKRSRPLSYVRAMDTNDTPTQPEPRGQGRLICAAHRKSLVYESCERPRRVGKNGQPLRPGQTPMRASSASASSARTTRPARRPAAARPAHAERLERPHPLPPLPPGQPARLRHARSAPRPRQPGRLALSTASSPATSPPPAPPAHACSPRRPSGRSSPCGSSPSPRSRCADERIQKGVGVSLPDGPFAPTHPVASAHAPANAVAPTRASSRNGESRPRGRDAAAGGGLLSPVLKPAPTVGRALDGVGGLAPRARLAAPGR